MSSTLSLTRRAWALKSSSRSLSTAPDSPAASNSSSSSSTLPPPTRKPLPKTPPPTPYHPYVHVPLVTLFKPTTPSDPLMVRLPSPLFNTPSRPSLLHSLIISHLASLRAGTASTKNRSEVNYSGKKIRPQKGTGKARLGSRGSPMLTGGGRAFGPRPKGPDGWTRKINRKEEQLGLRVGLSEKWRSGDLMVVERLAVEEVSTRIVRERLATRGWMDALFIVGKQDQEEQAFELAVGNLPDVAVVSEIDKLGVWDIVKRRKVVLELSAVDELIARLDPDNHWGVEDEEYDEEEMDEEDYEREIEEALEDVEVGRQA